MGALCDPAGWRVDDLEPPGFPAGTLKFGFAQASQASSHRSFRVSKAGVSISPLQALGSDEQQKSVALNRTLPLEPCTPSPSKNDLLG